MGRAQRSANAVTASSSERRVQARYTLQTPSGPQASATPGGLGGHRRQHIYGRLDCASALRAIAAGGPYPRYRVFFADEATAIACGYRPCARCMPGEYASWKSGTSSAARAPVRPYRVSAANAFDELLGSKRGAATVEDRPAELHRRALEASRNLIISSFENARADDFIFERADLDADFLVIFILDDTTQTARIVRTAVSREDAIRQLASPPEDYIPEHLVSLDISHPDLAIFPVYVNVNAAATCYECGHSIELDPDSSDGVWVHARDEGPKAYDLDEDHIARSEEEGNRTVVIGSDPIAFTDSNFGFAPER